MTDTTPEPDQPDQEATDQPQPPAEPEPYESEGMADPEDEPA